MNPTSQGSPLRRLTKGHYGGILMMLVGGATLSLSLEYRVGTLRSMGPGFYPAMLGVLLIVLGGALAAVSIQEATVARNERRKSQPEWRAWGCICASLIAFVLVGKYGGLLPASFLVVFISALGDRQNTLKSALILAVILCGISILVFAWALKIQLPLFQWG